MATVETIRHRDVPVVVVIGEIDSTTTAPVRAHVVDQLDRRPRRLVIDLSGVDFLGSTGLQLLAEAAVRAEAQGTTLAVVARNRAVLLPMRITEMDAEVIVRDTVDQAITAMRSR
ncbi:STAS domain-containing protein [Actinosynnema sp. CA-299493]